MEPFLIEITPKIESDVVTKSLDGYVLLESKVGVDVGECRNKENTIETQVNRTNRFITIKEEPDIESRIDGLNLTPDKQLLLPTSNVTEDKFETSNTSEENACKQTVDHLSLHDPVDPRYKCGYCHKAYFNKASLDGHINAHENRRPFKCFKCESSFTHKSYLTEHLTLHSNNRPHKCNVCPASFRQSGTLIRHKLTHTNHRSLMCQKCGRLFLRMCTLAEHLKAHDRQEDNSIHKYGPCEVCGKLFTKKSSIADHMNIHSGEKPHKCKMCGKCYGHRGTLNGHIKAKHS